MLLRPDSKLFNSKNSDKNVIPKALMNSIHPNWTFLLIERQKTYFTASTRFIKRYFLHYSLSLQFHPYIHMISVCCICDPPWASDFLYSPNSVLMLSISFNWDTCHITLLVSDIQQKIWYLHILQKVIKISPINSQVCFLFLMYF